MMLGKPPLIPREARIDFPTDTAGGVLAGVTRIGWGEQGEITKEKAAVVLRSLLAGGSCEGGDWSGFPLRVERFPPDCRGDVEQCQRLTRYLGIERPADWGWHVWQAERHWKRPEFRRLVVRVCSELERVEVLDKQALTDLLEEGEERCNV